MALTAVSAYYSTGSQLNRFLDGNVITPSGRDALVAGTYWPDTTTAGVLSGVSRSSYSGGDESNLPTGTYENLNFTSAVTLKNGRTYTFRNCMFSPDGTSADSAIMAYSTGTWTADFYDCTIAPTWPAHDDDGTTGGHVQAMEGIKGHHFRLYRCHITGTVDGVFIFNTESSGAVGTVVVQQCLIEKAAFWRPDEQARPEGTHNDGIAINSGSGISIVGNNIEWFNDPTIGDAPFSEFTGGDGGLHGLEAGNNPEQWANGDAIFVRRSLGVIDSLVIDQNRVTGGIVNLRISGSSGTITNLTITDNRFGNDGIDEGSAGVNVSMDTASKTDALDYTGNLQEDLTAFSEFLT